MSCVLLSDICTLMEVHLPKATTQGVMEGSASPPPGALRPQKGIRSLGVAASTGLLAAALGPPCCRGMRTYFEHLVEASHFRVGGRFRGQLEWTQGSA